MAYPVGGIWLDFRMLLRLFAAQKQNSNRNLKVSEAPSVLWPTVRNAVDLLASAAQAARRAPARKSESRCLLRDALKSPQRRKSVGRKRRPQRSNCFLNPSQYPKGSLEFVFPDPDNAPSARPQFRPYAAVSLNIPSQLLLPERRIVLRHVATARTAMPKTAINEDGYFQLSEDEVWPARKILMPAPSGDSVRPKNTRER